MTPERARERHLLVCAGARFGAAPKNGTSIAANFIIGLTRRTAACFTARPLDPVRVKTRKRLDAINAIFLRAAVVEVACHPADAKALRQTYVNLDRLPPSILIGG